MEGLYIDVLSMQQKVEKIEIKVETSTVQVINEVFRFREIMFPNISTIPVATVDWDLDTRVDGVEVLTMTIDEPS